MFLLNMAGRGGKTVFAGYCIRFCKYFKLLVILCNSGSVVQLELHCGTLLELSGSCDLFIVL